MDAAQNPKTSRTGPFNALRTGVEAAYYWLRRALGLAYSILLRDSLTRLRLETEQLGSAAVESASYVGAELRSIDERVARLEEELAAIRELLEQRRPVGGRTPD